MKRTITAALLAFACQDVGALGELRQSFTGDVGADPNPLTFWWYAADPAEVRPAIECALERIRAATCLPVDISLDAAHWVRQRTAESMGGRLGWTTGSSWDSTRIALKTLMGPQTNCRVLVHEIAQHVLRQANDHAGATYRLDQPLIDSICEVQDCGCSVPETDDNPVDSTEGTCD